jgi:hypothetical protein
VKLLSKMLAYALRLNSAPIKKADPRLWFRHHLQPARDACGKMEFIADCIEVK